MNNAVFVGPSIKVLQQNITWAREMFYDDETLLAKYPDAYAQSWFRKGVLLVKRGIGHNEKGQTKEARDDLMKTIDAYKKAVEKKPDYVYAHCALGNAYRLLSLLEYAPVKETVSANSVSVDLIHRYTRNGLDAAEQAFRNALALDGSHWDSSQGLEEISALKKGDEGISDTPMGLGAAE